MKRSSDPALGLLGAGGHYRKQDTLVVEEGTANKQGIVKDEKEMNDEWEKDGHDWA